MIGAGSQKEGGLSLGLKERREAFSGLPDPIRVRVRVRACPSLPDHDARVKERMSREEGDLWSGDLGEGQASLLSSGHGSVPCVEE